MTPGKISLACAVLLSAVYLSTGQSGIPIDDNIEDAVYLNSTRQVVTLVSALTNIGDNLTTIVINFNRSVVSEIVSATYSLYGSGRLYVSVDHKGVVTLKQRPRVTTFTIGFSVLVRVRAVGRNGSFPVFLSGTLVLRSVGIVRFNDSSIFTSIRAFLPVGTPIYNLTKNVEIETRYIQSFSLSYSGYSSYFYLGYNGIVTTRRELSPTTYYARPRMNYQITFKNGSLFSSYEYISFRVAVLGCRLNEEGSVEWPTMGSCQRAEHTCTKYHPLLKGGTVARHCDSAGKSSVPDFSRCCVQKSGSSPFALVWFTYSGVSSTTYLSNIETIKRSVSRLFGSSATAVALFSAYRSNRYYGFSMSFTVTLRPDVRIRTVQTALRLLKSYRRFAVTVAYLRYESESRGIRAFMPSSCCEPYNYTADVTSTVNFIRIPFCCGTTSTPCTCTTSSNCTASFYNARLCTTCTNPSLKSPDPKCPEETTPIPTTAPIPHNRTCIRFNESSYTGRVYIGSSARGTKILTVGVVACDSTIIKNYTAHFALNGYLSDYFDIGKPSGVITTSGLRLTVRLYSFYVSAFIDITYKNGTRIQNFTETNVRIDVNGGISLNQTYYRITAPVDSAVNTSSILDLGAEVVTDPTYVKKTLSLTFTRVSNSNFGITKEGHIYPRAPLIANINYYLTAYYTYTIIDMNDKQVTFSAYVRVYVRSQGCRQEEGGSYVWPVTHACGIVNVSCFHFDSSFDNYGHVRRQCRKDGVWLTPDLSQCRLKAGSPPFVLLWFTFSSVYTRHWNEIYTPRTLGELQSYMSDFPVTGITVHHNKESKVLYGFVQSFKAELRPGSTLNGTLLQVLKDKITTVRRIGGRTKSTQSYTAGVIGVTTSDRCIQYEITANVTDYTPVCVLSDTAKCTCKKTPRVNSMCCTNKGQINQTLDMCRAPGKTIIVPDAKKATITMSLKRSGQSMLVSWTLSGGDTPDYYEVVYRSKDHEQRLMVNKTESSVNVTGLLPGTSYTVSVRGYYSNGESISSLQAIWIEDKTIFIFQILLSGVTSCPQLKANMDNLRRVVANTVSAGCQCSFSLDRLALAVDQCPYGKSSDNMAMMRGWIYDTSDSPEQKYFPYMQKMASKDVSITAGDLKLNAAQVCASSCSSNQEPPTSPFISPGGSTTAGTVVGIIIGIVGCVLLAVILIVLILRFKNGKNQPEPTPGKTSGSAVGVSLSETTKGMEDDDDAELQKDF